LAHEQVSDSTIDRERGGDKAAPKNGVARLPMSIEPELMPLVVAMFRETSVTRSTTLHGTAMLKRFEPTYRSRESAAANCTTDPTIRREWMTLHVGDDVRNC
jgi:hypothetical protein